jgi:hypothetical protein
MMVSTTAEMKAVEMVALLVEYLDELMALWMAEQMAE